MAPEIHDLNRWHIARLIVIPPLINRLSDWNLAHDQADLDASYCMDAPDVLPAGGCFYWEEPYQNDSETFYDFDWPQQITTHRLPSFQQALEDLIAQRGKVWIGPFVERVSWIQVAP